MDEVELPKESEDIVENNIPEKKLGLLRHL